MTVTRTSDLTKEAQSEINFKMKHMPLKVFKYNQGLYTGQARTLTLGGNGWSLLRARMVTIDKEGRNTVYNETGQKLHSCPDNPVKDFIFHSKNKGKP